MTDPLPQLRHPGIDVPAYSAVHCVASLQVRTNYVLFIESTLGCAQNLDQDFDSRESIPVKIDLVCQ